MQRGVTDADVHYSLKGRLDSFDSVDSFDLVSVGGGSSACSIVDDEHLELNNVDAEGEWEDLGIAHNPFTNPEQRAMDDVTMGDDDVQIQVNEGFESAIQAALGIAPTTSTPRRPSARESLRDFYLARAKTSAERSKQFRALLPPVVPAAIAQLRAPERYSVEVLEHVTRENNMRRAQDALREFYAQREEQKARRAAINRANENVVYQSQIGLCCNQATCWEPSTADAGSTMAA